MRDSNERDRPLALHSAHCNRLRKAVGWYRNNHWLHTGDPIAMAAGPTDAYSAARAEGTDATIICDKWKSPMRSTVACTASTPTEPLPRCG